MHLVSRGTVEIVSQSTHELAKYHCADDFITEKVCSIGCCMNGQFVLDPADPLPSGF